MYRRIISILLLFWMASVAVLRYNDEPKVILATSLIGLVIAVRGFVAAKQTEKVEGYEYY
jgi:hypothetical protein